MAVRPEACRGAMQVALVSGHGARPHVWLLPASHRQHHAYEVGLTAAQRAGPAERRRVCRLVATIFLSIHTSNSKAVSRA